MNKMINKNNIVIEKTPNKLIEEGIKNQLKIMKTFIFQMMKVI